MMSGLFSKLGLSCKKADKDSRELARSSVRIRVTYWAAMFLFGGGSLLIGFFIYKDNLPLAKDLFMTILPISAATISYWFAGRKTEKETPNNEKTEEHSGKTEP